MSQIDDLPDSFVEQVKAALEKLYDFQALQENELAQIFAAQQTDSHLSGAHKLRSQLIEAIESLNHSENVASHSGTARIYNLIYMHYIGKMTVQQIAWEVGVSLRQAYRDLRRGQELVSSVLWHKLNAKTVYPQQVSSFKEELVRLGDNTTVTVLQEMLDSAIRAIQILAEKYEIQIVVQSSKPPIKLTTNPIIAQQILIHVLSQIIQQLKPTNLSIQLFDDDNFIRMHCASVTCAEFLIKPVIEEMMVKINWELEYRLVENAAEVLLQSPQQRFLVVLIDDNEGLIDLVQRYLSDNLYTVLSIPNTDEGLQLIQQLEPDVIILDLMMPGMDGWEVLQRLRTQTATKNIPVVICSVINDPELAFSLGASQYIAKPITREALFRALQELDILRQHSP
jgi:CheY-like chemotaxis protein